MSAVCVTGERKRARPRRGPMSDDRAETDSMWASQAHSQHANDSMIDVAIMGRVGDTQAQ